MTTPPDTTPANPYPLTLTRTDLVANGACPDGLEAFDALCPDGVLTIPDAYAHSALLATPLAAYEDWVVKEGLLPPGCVQGPDRTTVAAGYKGTATAGDYGHATAGYYGHATAGYAGRATAGDYGHATAGNCGHATAGYWGTAIAGDYGHSTAGVGGTATAGEGGTLRLAYLANGRLRWAIAYVGEDGIEPNVPYKVDLGGKVVRAS